MTNAANLAAVASTTYGYANATKLQSGGVTTNALAWVNFNGVTTVSIRSSYNVSSVTRNSTGLYTIAFSNNLSDANYAINATGFWYSGASTNAAWTIVEVTTNQTTRSATASSFQINSVNSNFSNTDCGSANIIVFGN